jgi:hypothetical protein
VVQCVTGSTRHGLRVVGYIPVNPIWFIKGREVYGAAYMVLKAGRCMGLPMVLAPKRPLKIFWEELVVIPIPGFCLVADTCMSMIVTKKTETLNTTQEEHHSPFDFSEHSTILITCTMYIMLCVNEEVPSPAVTIINLLLNVVGNQCTSKSHLTLSFLGIHILLPHCKNYLLNVLMTCMWSSLHLSLHCYWTCQMVAKCM